jgi:hypothetical protein
MSEPFSLLLQKRAEQHLPYLLRRSGLNNNDADLLDLSGCR